MENSAQFIYIENVNGFLNLFSVINSLSRSLSLKNPTLYESVGENFSLFA